MARQQVAGCFVVLQEPHEDFGFSGPALASSARPSASSASAVMRALSLVQAWSRPRTLSCAARAVSPRASASVGWPMRGVDQTDWNARDWRFDARCQALFPIDGDVPDDNPEYLARPQGSRLHLSHPYRTFARTTEAAGACYRVNAKGTKPNAAPPLGAGPHVSRQAKRRVTRRNPTAPGGLGGALKIAAKARRCCS